MLLRHCCQCGRGIRLIGKLVSDFLLVIIELFFARCFRFVTIHACDGQTDIHTDVITIGTVKTSVYVYVRVESFRLKRVYQCILHS